MKLGAVPAHVCEPGEPFETVNTVDGLVDAFVSVKLPVDAVVVKLKVRLAFTAPLARVSVTTFEFAEFPIVMVGSLVDTGKPPKVPVAVSVVALVFRVNTFDGLTAELVTVIVGAVVDVGAPETVPIACAVVALVVRVNWFKFDELVIVRDVEVNGGLEKLPVSCAAVASVVRVNV